MIPAPFLQGQVAMSAFGLALPAVVWLVTRKNASMRIAAAASTVVLYVGLHCGFLAVPPPPNLRGATKVFGIGLSRTGTTSLTLALNQVNINTYHALPHLLQWPRNGQPPLLDEQWAAAYDGLTDIQPALVFRSLAQRFPDAKFIYNHPPPKLWAEAMHRFMNKHSNLWTALQVAHDWVGLVPPVERLFEAIYGNWRGYSVEDWEVRYYAHDDAVATFFKNSSSRLLNISFTQGEGWEKLGGFLGIHPPPKGPFPHADVFALTATYQPYWQIKNLVSWVLSLVASCGDQSLSTVENEL